MATIGIANMIQSLLYLRNYSMFTTDSEFLSDGYRVQFQRVIDHETGEENIVDVIVEHAHLGSG